MKRFSQKYFRIDLILLLAIFVSILKAEFNSGNSNTGNLQNNYASINKNNPDSVKQIIVAGDFQKTFFWEKIIGRESNDVERKLIVDEISKENPAMLVLLGDLVFDGSSESDWEEFDELMIPVTQKNIPIKPVLGNHEYWGSNKSALKNFSDRFKEFNESHWYSFTFDSLAMIFLDSNIDELSEEEWNDQKDWFEKQLTGFDNDSSVIGVLVFLHHPPYTNSTVTSDEIHVQDAFVNSFIKSIKSLAMISGHAHGYERFYKNRKTFIVSGGCGGPRVELKDSTEAQHKDLLLGDLDTSARRPFNFLKIERKNDSVNVVVRGLLKNTNLFIDIETFTLAVHPE